MTLQCSNSHRYIGIDYSGAETAESSLKGLRVYLAGRDGPPEEVQPPPSPRKYWNRQEIAAYLVERLSEPIPTLVGIDHAFGFPLAYFDRHRLPRDWRAFLRDFREHWPTHERFTYVDFIRDGSVGNGAARDGDTKWRRITDLRAGAKSPFHFDVPGSVAKSTHAGLPWLLHIAEKVPDVHFWPFDGWDISETEGRSVIAEAYPALWSKAIPKTQPTGDQHDAYCIAEWMRQRDADGTLSEFFHPTLPDAERHIAELEGWILGVAGMAEGEETGVESWSKRKPSTGRKGKRTMPQTGSIHRLKITLQDIKPPIWRTVEVPSGFGLDQVHTVFQDVMPWTYSHLHEFNIGKKSYGPLDDEFDFIDDPADTLSEAQAVLGKVLPRKGAKMDYEYDFGDGWVHRVTVE